MKQYQIVILLYCSIAATLILIAMFLFLPIRHSRAPSQVPNGTLEDGNQASKDSRIHENDKTKENTDLSLNTPSLNQIFSDNHSWIATLSAQHLTKMIVTGDIIPARSVNNAVVIRNNPLWPYEKVAEGINAQKADIIFANLETPLLKDCPVTTEGMIFCGSNKNVEGLKFIGINIVSLANNHAGNHDIAGVEETVAVLKQNNIDVTGLNGSLYKTIHGIHFAFLGYNDITAPQPGIENVDENVITQEIRVAKQKADVIIVMLHWGVEYRNQPDDRQIYLAHFIMDQGADLIVSNHPHWIQPIEIYNGKLIMYAHGNFIFDQMWSEETRKGVIGIYTFYDKQLIDIQFLPIYIQNYGQAEFILGDAKRSVLDHLKIQSEILQQRLR